MRDIKFISGQVEGHDSAGSHEVPARPSTTCRSYV